MYLKKNFIFMICLIGFCFTSLFNSTSIMNDHTLREQAGSAQVVDSCMNDDYTTNVNLLTKNMKQIIRTMQLQCRVISFLAINFVWFIVFIALQKYIHYLHWSYCITELNHFLCLNRRITEYIEWKDGKKKVIMHP